MNLRRSVLHRHFLCFWACLFMLFVSPLWAADYNVPEYRAAVEDAKEALPSKSQRTSGR